VRDHASSAVEMPLQRAVTASGGALLSGLQHHIVHVADNRDLVWRRRKVHAARMGGDLGSGDHPSRRPLFLRRSWPAPTDG
jgi:hypothetical protein